MGTWEDSSESQFHYDYIEQFRNAALELTLEAMEHISLNVRTDAESLPFESEFEPATGHSETAWAIQGDGVLCLISGMTING